MKFVEFAKNSQRIYKARKTEANIDDRILFTFVELQHANDEIMNSTRGRNHRVNDRNTITILIPLNETSKWIWSFDSAAERPCKRNKRNIYNNKSMEISNEQLRSIIDERNSKVQQARFSWYVYQ